MSQHIIIGSLLLVVGGSCACPETACVAQTFMHFDPPLSEPGAYRIELRDEQAQRTVSCEIVLPSAAEHILCGNTPAMVEITEEAVSSLRLSSGAFVLAPEVEISVTRDGELLRSGDVELEYSERPREDYQGCGPCREAHTNL